MFCTKCGKENPDGTKFCGSCGAEIGNTNPTPQPVGQAVNQPQQSNPIQNNQPNNEEPKPKSDSKYAVMSVGEFFGSMLIMAIPVIGWIFAIVWACGGTKKVNKANLARATLINIAICIAIWVAVGSVVKLAINTIGEMVGGFIPGISSGEGFDLDGLLNGDSLDSLMQQFGGGSYTSL